MQTNILDKDVLKRFELLIKNIVIFTKKEEEWCYFIYKKYNFKASCSCGKFITIVMTNKLDKNKEHSSIIFVNVLTKNGILKELNELILFG